MKKLTRTACLVAALVLSAFATADASWGWVDCYYTCNGETVRIDRWYGYCCGTQFERPDGTTCYALWWEQLGYVGEYCMI